ncbi:MAG: hypothetical protein RBT57_03715 [Paludibacter sp.]|jgi:YesN/AraC family two-component response regulator|nr:hypothetical protein [Paludibacter sp.]
MQNDESVRKTGRLFVQNLAIFFLNRKGKTQIEEGTIDSENDSGKAIRELKVHPLGNRIIRRHRYKSMYEKIKRVTDGVSVVQVNTRYELMTDNLLEKVHYLMKCKKRYKDPTVNLEDIACELGTNRTYMSRVINQKHKTRFNGFINTYRYNELIELLDKYPHLNRSELANLSGFNSVTTMMRVIKQHSGLKYKEWKLKVCSSTSDFQIDNKLQEH